jgi:hypothetical protein
MGKMAWSDPVTAKPMLDRIPLGRFAEVTLPDTLFSERGFFRFPGFYSTFQKLRLSVHGFWVFDLLGFSGLREFFAPSLNAVSLCPRADCILKPTPFVLTGPQSEKINIQTASIDFF